MTASVRTYTVTPEEFGLQRVGLETLAGAATPQLAAVEMRAILRQRVETQVVAQGKGTNGGNGQDRDQGQSPGNSFRSGWCICHVGHVRSVPTGSIVL